MWFMRSFYLLLLLTTESPSSSPLRRYEIFPLAFRRLWSVLLFLIRKYGGYRVSPQAIFQLAFNLPSVWLQRIQRDYIVCLCAHGRRARLHTSRENCFDLCALITIPHTHAASKRREINGMQSVVVAETLAILLLLRISSIYTTWINFISMAIACATVKFRHHTSIHVKPSNFIGFSKNPGKTKPRRSKNTLSHFTLHTQWHDGWVILISYIFILNWLCLAQFWWNNPNI